VNAIILAAGSDNLLGDISQNGPKCLIQIEGSSLLEIQVNTLHACGIENIAVVRGFEAEQINVPGLRYYDNPAYADTGVLHSLFSAVDEMTDDVLIIYGDILFEEQTVQRLLESKHDIAAGVIVNISPNVDPSQIEMVYFDAENRITKTGKNLVDEYETQGQYIGMVKCSRRGVEIIKQNYSVMKALYAGKRFNKSESFEKAWLTDFFSEMAGLGVPLHCIIFERGWLEINTRDDYERALHDTQFVRRLVKIKTDWDSRALTYNNLEWVKKDDTLNVMLDLAGNLTGMKILDVGTGTGKVLEALRKKYPKAQYFGIDTNQSMMGKIDPSLGFKLSVGKIEDLTVFGDNEFDLVTARMVLHHADDLNQAFYEMRRVLKPGGKLMVCEGNPPNRHSLAFYEAMFRFKEQRHTFLLDDLVGYLILHDFHDITTKTIILKDMSLNNWLANAGVPYRNIDIIRRMHFECDTAVKNAYRMRVVGDDIIMDWKFSVVLGVK